MRRAECGAVSLLSSSPLQHCSTAPLHLCTAAPLHCCTAAPLHPCRLGAELPLRLLAATLRAHQSLLRSSPDAALSVVARVASAAEGGDEAREEEEEEARSTQSGAPSTASPLPPTTATSASASAASGTFTAFPTPAASAASAASDSHPGADNPPLAAALPAAYKQRAPPPVVVPKTATTAAPPPRRAAIRLRLHGARWLLPGEPQAVAAARGRPVLSTLQAEMQAALQAADRRGTHATMEPTATAAFARAAAAVFAPEGLLWRLSHGTLRALESHNEYFSLYLLPFSRLVARLWLPPPQDEPRGAALAALAALATLPAELRDAIRVSDDGPPAETTGPRARDVSGRGLVRLGRADDPAFGSDDEVRPLTQLLMRLRRLASTPQLPSGCTWLQDWRPLEVLGHGRLQLGGIAIDAAGSVWPHDLSRAARSGAVDDCCRLLLELLLEGLQVAEDVGSLRPWARSPAELQLRLREQLGVPEPVLARLCSLLCDEIRATDPASAAADPATAAPAEAEAAAPELSEMALSRAIEAAAAAAEQGEAATAALCAHLRLKLTVDTRRCEGQLLHATRIVDALLPSEGSVQLWEAAGALEGAVSAALVHLSATAQSHGAVLASRQWKLAGASVTSAHAAVNAFAAAAASGPEQASVLVAEAVEGESAAPAVPSLDLAVAGAKARQRSRAKTTDFTSAAPAPAVAGAKMRQRSKSTTDLFARPTLGEAKQKLADEQKLAAARREPHWPSRLQLVGAGAAALLRRAYELALSCSAQANGGTADPRDLHLCTWQLPLLLHATRCLRYAELSSWQLRLAWHLALRLSTSASGLSPPPHPCLASLLSASPPTLASPASLPAPTLFPSLPSASLPFHATDQLAHHRACGGAALDGAARRPHRC